MKIFGLTTIYSCGLDGGSESVTLLFNSPEERMKAAYAKYTEEFDFQVKEGNIVDGCDENDNSKLSLDEFIKRAKEAEEYSENIGGLGLIQMPDWHFQIDFFEQEIASKRYSVINALSENDGYESLWVNDYSSIEEAEAAVRKDAADDFECKPEEVDDEYLLQDSTAKNGDKMYHYSNDGNDSFYIVHQQ